MLIISNILGERRGVRLKEGGGGAGGGTKLTPTKSVVLPSRRRPAVYVELPAGKILVRLC